MSGKDTLSNVWGKWFYSDLLTFVFMEDMEIIQEFNAMQKANNG